MAPGPELGRVLAGIDVSRLSGFDCVEVLRAQYRQLNHDTARFLGVMVEVGRCTGLDELSRSVEPHALAADEIRAALMWSRRAAEGRFALAYDLITRLPGVYAALQAGVLDEPRARAFSEWTLDLTGEQARQLCEMLLAEASGMVLGSLVDRIKKCAIAIDPDWAQRRYESALAERKVVGSRNPDGSANLSGQNLPLEQTIAAAARIDALAKAAKHGGHPGRIDHLRADLFLGLLDGRYLGLDDATIIATLLADPAAGDDDEPDEGPDKGDDDPDPGDDTAGESDGGGGDHADDSEAEGDGDGSGDCDAGGPEPGPEPDPGPDPDSDLDLDLESAGCAGPARGRGRVELRVQLSTLLGFDEHPGEVAGWGPVHAGLARGLVRAHTGGQWRLVLTDPAGQLVSAGVTRRRPSGWARSGCGGIVELQLPAALLDELSPEQCGEWAGIITELRGLAGQQSNPVFAADAGRRFPAAALRRYIQIRDRCCNFPPCRAPAASSEIDHTREHAHGGPTVEANLGGVCRHDHRLKTEGGWQLRQPEPGHFLWISPLGHSYPIRPPPIIEALPDRAPREAPTEPGWLSADDDWEDTSIGPDSELGKPPPHPEIKPGTEPPPF